MVAAEPLTLILPGAQKSASTTLFRILERHPAIAVAIQKEPAVFSMAGKSPDTGDPYPQGMFALSDETVYRMDGSQSYLGVEGVAEEMANRLGDSARFIVLLRRPVDRAESAFNYFSGKPGGETEREIGQITPPDLDSLDLPSLLRWEEGEVQKHLRGGSIEGRNPSWNRLGYPFRYFKLSAYGRNLKPFLSSFNRKQFLFLRFEDVVTRQDWAVRTVLEFLGLESASLLDERVHANPTLSYKSEGVGGVIGGAKDLLRKFAPMVPEPVRRGVRGIERRWLMEKPSARFDAAVRRRLAEIFEPDVAETEKLTGLDLSLWRIGAEPSPEDRLRSSETT